MVSTKGLVSKYEPQETSLMLRQMPRKCLYKQARTSLNERPRFAILYQTKKAK